MYLVLTKDNIENISQRTGRTTEELEKILDDNKRHGRHEVRITLHKSE